MALSFLYGPTLSSLSVKTSNSLSKVCFLGHGPQAGRAQPGGSHWGPGAQPTLTGTAAEGSTCSESAGPPAGHPGDTSALPTIPATSQLPFPEAKRATALPASEGMGGMQGPLVPGRAPPALPARPQHRAHGPIGEVSAARWQTSRPPQKLRPQCFSNDPTLGTKQRAGPGQSWQDAGSLRLPEVSSSRSPGTSRGRGLARGTWARPRLWGSHTSLPAHPWVCSLQPPMPQPGTRPTFTPAGQQHLWGEWWSVPSVPVLLRPGPTWPPLGLSRDDREDWKWEGLDASPVPGSPGGVDTRGLPGGGPLHLAHPLLPRTISDRLSVSVASWGRGKATDEPSSARGAWRRLCLSPASGPFSYF